jgi:hypothetical protein
VRSLSPTGLEATTQAFFIDAEIVAAFAANPCAGTHTRDKEKDNNNNVIVLSRMPT